MKPNAITAENRPSLSQPKVPIITLEDAELTTARRTKKLLSKRMASDTDLWFSIREHQERYSRMASLASSANERLEASHSILNIATMIMRFYDRSPTKDKIFINRVEMPTASNLHSTSKGSGGSGAPTPVNKRVLDQEEFNKRLKAKRAIFSGSRSLSLASFRLPVSVPK